MFVLFNNLIDRRQFYDSFTTLKTVLESTLFSFPYLGYGITKYNSSGIDLNYLYLNRMSRLNHFGQFRIDLDDLTLMILV